MVNRNRCKDDNPLSRGYLSRERGAIIKKWRGKTPVCVVFPNSYYIGMSNLALHILYATLNSDPNIVCERCFFSEGEEPRSLESGKPLASFEIIFITLSFELDYINMTKLLSTADIPVLSSERKDGDLIVVAGGICVMANPEPVSRFVDLFIMGDVETTVPLFMKKYMEIKEDKRHAVISELSGFDWVYNPDRLDVSYSPDGTIEMFKPPGFSVTIKPYKGRNLGTSAIITRETEFADMYLVEGTRGCPSRCPFCLLGNTYSFTYDRLENIATDGGDIGIIGGGVSFHPQLVQIIKFMKQAGKHAHLPSLRIDEVTTELVGLIQDEVKTLTFGIEAGNERLRKFFGKPLSDDAIYEKLDAILAMKPFNLKLYFMIGLHGEEKKDLEDILAMVKHVHHIMVKTGAPKGYMGSVTIHVSPFVPKASTPFQWLPMEEMDALKEKITWLKKGLAHVGNTYFTHESVKYSVIQGIFARGDRRVGDAILRFARGDSFSKVMRESPINLNFYVHRERNKDELFPWDFIKGRQKKEALWKRLNNQLKTARS
ncbi:MAG: radical SAM protein [Syntrophorhabdus sp.]